jgi:type VI protein secretion system component Hcp
LVLPLASWSWAEHAPGKPQESGDISISTKTGKHSSDLLLRTAEGRSFKTVVIVVPGKDGKGVTITLHDVVITSYQLTGDMETWSLSFATKEFSQSPPQTQPRP